MTNSAARDSISRPGVALIKFPLQNRNLQEGKHNARASARVKREINIGKININKFETLTHIHTHMHARRIKY